MVRAADARRGAAGVEVLAAVAGGDVLVVDVGGATTDVYSVLTPQGEDAPATGQARRLAEVVAPLWHARTVEGDLGMRWNAAGVVEAAAAEGLLAPARRSGLAAYAARRRGRPGALPPDTAERLARRLGARHPARRARRTVALRRHGRARDGDVGAPAAARRAPRRGQRGRAPARPTRRTAAHPVGGRRPTTAAGWRVPEARADHRRRRDTCCSPSGCWPAPTRRQRARSPGRPPDPPDGVAVAP